MCYNSGMKRILILFLAACFSQIGLAVAIPSACEAALRRALDADAAFRMERRFPNMNRTLISTGVVSCATGRGIVWDVRHPFPSSVTMTTNAMIRVDDGLRTTKALSELPHYDDLRRKTDAFAAGDAHAFDGLFDVTVKGDDANWTLTLKPSARALRRLLAEVSVSGGETFDRAVLTAADGGVTTIIFTELGRGVHSLWKDSAP